MKVEQIGTIDVSGLEAIADGYQPRNKTWSEEELDVLRQFYGRVPTSAIAETLDRSVGSVQNKVVHLGLKVP